MTWTKLSDTFNDDPRLLSVSHAARLLYVNGLVYCNRHLTDGLIPQAALVRFTDLDEPASYADELVAAELWDLTDAGWAVVDFLETQESRETVKGRQSRWAERQKRRRLHLDGDHSMCQPKYCSAVSRVTDSVSHGVSHGVSHATPSRPDPTRPVRDKGRGEEGAGATGTRGLGAAPPFGLPDVKNLPPVSFVVDPPKNKR